MTSGPLSEAAPARRTGLYVHIPFCAVKCHYCNFVITLDRSTRMRERFFSAFEKEIQAAVRLRGPLSFDTVYFGGGTPSELTAEEFTRAVHLLRGAFSLEKVREFTVEINPGDISLEKIRAFREAGVDRASVGAQAFQPALLETMGRPHGPEETRETVRLLKEEGIRNISLDLIFRLPGQSLADFQTSLAEALALAPMQMTLYDLEVHDKTRFGILNKRGELDLPGEDVHYAMFETAVKTLEAEGFRHYELLSFARPGGESRHNMIYWENQDYLGLGPGAFSYLTGTRYQFSESVPQYLHKCETEDWMPSVSDTLTPEKIEWESVLTGLRLDRGISLEAFPRIRSVLEPALRRLAEAGLIEMSGFRVFLTLRGRALAETVFSSLIQAS